MIISICLLCFIFGNTSVSAQESDRSQNRNQEQIQQQEIEFIQGSHRPEDRINPRAHKTPPVIFYTMPSAGDPALLDFDENGDLIVSDDTSGGAFNTIVQEGESFDSYSQEELDAMNPIERMLVGMKRFVSEVVFTAKTYFTNIVHFIAPVRFDDRVTYADNDFAGYASIASGLSQVEIVFEKPFESAPIVHVTPVDAFYQLSIADVRKEGFTVRTKDRMVDEDLSLHWIAFHVEDPRTIKGILPEETEETEETDSSEAETNEVDTEEVDDSNSEPETGIEEDLNTHEDSDANNENEYDQSEEVSQDQDEESDSEELVESEESNEVINSDLDVEDDIVSEEQMTDISDTTEDDSSDGNAL